MGIKRKNGSWMEDGETKESMGKERKEG